MRERAFESRYQWASRTTGDLAFLFLFLTLVSQNVRLIKLSPPHVQGKNSPFTNSTHPFPPIWLQQRTIRRCAKRSTAQHSTALYLLTYLPVKSANP